MTLYQIYPVHNLYQTRVLHVPRSKYSIHRLCLREAKGLRDYLEVWFYWKEWTGPKYALKNDC